MIFTVSPSSLHTPIRPSFLAHSIAAASALVSEVVSWKTEGTSCSASSRAASAAYLSSSSSLLFAASCSALTLRRWRISRLLSASATRGGEFPALLPLPLVERSPHARHHR